MDRHETKDAILSSAMGIAMAVVVAARVVYASDLLGDTVGRAYFAGWFMEVGTWLLAGVLIFGGLLRTGWGDGSRGIMIGAGALCLLLAPVAGL